MNFLFEKVWSNFFWLLKISKKHLILALFNFFLIGIAFWLYLAKSERIHCQCFSFVQICDIAKVVLIHRKDLDKFWLEAKKKNESTFSKHPLYFWLLYLNHVYKSGEFSLKILVKFFWLLKNLQKHLILALFIFNRCSFLAIFSQQNKKKGCTGSR